MYTTVPYYHFYSFHRQIYFCLCLSYTSFRFFCFLSKTICQEVNIVVTIVKDKDPYILTSLCMILPLACSMHYKPIWHTLADIGCRQSVPFHPTSQVQMVRFEGPRQEMNPCPLHSVHIFAYYQTKHLYKDNLGGFKKKKANRKYQTLFTSISLGSS